MPRNVDGKDLLNIPTVVTVSSFGLVLKSAQKIDTTEGKIGVVIGRLGDVVDGYLARKLDMTSDAGAIADATADKLGLVAIGKSLWDKEIVPKPILATLAVKHSINALATIYNGLNDEDKRSIRPPKSGKISMALDNLSLFSFMLADEFEDCPKTHKIASNLGYIAFSASIVFGIDATSRYLKSDFDEEK